MHDSMLLHLIMRASFSDTSHPRRCDVLSTVYPRLCEAPVFTVTWVSNAHPLPTSSPRPVLRAMPRTESDMHLAQLSHLILHAGVWHAYCTAITSQSSCPRLTCPACFSSTSHPLRSLFNPQARLTQGGERLGSECQHRVCTLLQHMVCHNLVSESGCRERQRLACTIVCYYTSLCVPVFQIRHTRQGGTYCPLCIRACARRQCSRSHG